MDYDDIERIFIKTKNILLQLKEEQGYLTDADIIEHLPDNLGKCERQFIELLEMSVGPIFYQPPSADDLEVVEFFDKYPNWVDVRL